MNPKNRIWSIISHIPRGKVISYGAVASLAGLPGHARYVGYTLKHLPSDSSLPWHRVINSKGRISFQVGTERYQTQKSKLEKEGVVFSGKKISMSQYGWHRAKANHSQCSQQRKENFKICPPDRDLDLPTLFESYTKTK